MSLATLLLLSELLNAVSLPVKHPQFAEHAAVLAAAKQELAAAVAEAQSDA